MQERAADDRYLMWQLAGALLEVEEEGLVEDL
jgi:hypothetical protein